MEKKNKLRLVTLIILVLAIVVLLFLSQQGTAPAIDPSLFRVDQPEKIDHVTLESSSGKIELAFADGRWRVNGVHEADKQMIKVLFATLEQVIPRRELGKAKKDTVMKAFAKSGIAVTLFEGAGQKLTFTTTGNEQKTETYFQTQDGRVYAMNIPGYRVYVNGIFEAGEGVWRDKLIFNLNWRNFRELTTRFPAKPKEDFHISYKGNYFGIDGISESDTTRLNDYLDAVSLLETDEFLSGKRKATYDSLLKTTPAFTIEVKDIADRVFSLDVFAPERNNAVVVGRTQTGEVALFNRNTIAPIAKNKSYFVASKPK